MDPKFSSETYTPDRLLFNTDGVRTGGDVLLTGNGVLARGTVLARDSANGNKLVPVDSASATASVTEAVAILADEADTSSGDVEAEIYWAGEFNEDQLTFGGTDVSDTHRDAMRKVGLYMRTPVSA